MRMTGRGVLTLGALVPGLLLVGGAGIFAGTFRALEATGASPHIKKTTPFDVGYFLKQYDRLTTKKKAA
ncbi:MAG: hypothetical protein Q8Q94_01600 [bacterium]|nr:hypothetical protein [bacterium]MDZ4299695.1 hypothetical protein [Candidatus Sungbacteria bacterium]